MIYSPNNRPLVLVEAAADSFLESVGVKLYDNEISINGTLYEGSYGESILADNGIFLYEDGIVLEGEQAEDYKARKAKEKAKSTNNSSRKKYGLGTNIKDISAMKFNDEYTKRANKANIYHDPESNKNNIASKNRLAANYDRVRDALERNMRRHPDTYGISKHDVTLHKRKHSDAYLKQQAAIAKAQEEARKGREEYLKIRNGSNRHTNESTIFSNIDII